jgi:hypothetical protein
LSDLRDGSLVESSAAGMQLERAVKAIFPASTSSLSFFIRSLHPGLQIGIGEIGDPICGLPAYVVGDVSMGRILAKDWLSARNPGYLAGCDPPDLVKGEIGRRRALLRGNLRSLRHVDKAGQHAARQNAGSQSG